MKLNEIVKEFILEVKNLKVAVIGETIIDEFIPVYYEGQSMKSICPVFRIAGEKVEQQGGALAIANHLRGFVKSVELISNKNKEIVKTRYVDVDDKKKHSEVNKFEVTNFRKIHCDTSKYDIIIVADFGHGFCDKLKINDGFHLMCQTNSNNFGFNRVSKWKSYRKKSVCLDLREAGLQMNKKLANCSDVDALSIYNYELNAEDLFLTIGSKGSIFTDGKEVRKHPSFKSQIVDTIGAGDAFFSFATLASEIGLPSEEKLIIPSLAASLSTTWLCNERSVTPEKLIEYANKFI